jgi:CHASE3 domain sensor protein
VAITAALVAFGLGTIVIIAWYAHWPRVLQIIPDTAPMQFNTALCFIVCGAGLLLLNTRFRGGTVWCGCAAASVTLLTVLEYLTQRNFHIDEIFVKPYFETASAYPGRMAPLTAFCFVGYGTALTLAGGAGRGARHWTAAGLLACIVAVAGTVALLGYAANIESAFGWGAYSKMAINTAMALVVLGGGLLLLCWHTAAEENFDFLQWVPIAASSTLLVMVAAISVSTVMSLRSAMDWRKHTYEVLLTAQSFGASVKDIQSGLLGFRLTGRPVFLGSYNSGISAARLILGKLIELTRDNPAQQQRLQVLTDNLAGALSSASHLMKTPAHIGMPVQASLDGCESMFGGTNASLDLFTQEEQRLLSRRTLTADSEFRSTARLVGVSCALAAIFFVTGSILVRRGIDRRHRLELQLREANSKLHTLSGLLPICAHCKSIRDDKGYWNQLEAYVQKHSEAKFTHGLCEKCIKELYPDVADEVLEKVRENSPRRA